MSYTPPDPVEKLPLAANKNIREKWNTQYPILEERICLSLGLESFSFIVDFPQLFAFGKSIHIGHLIFCYFEQLTIKISEITNNTAHTYAQTALRSLVYKNTATVMGDDLGQHVYNRTTIQDGVLHLYFNAGYIGVNQHDVAKDLPNLIDDHLEERGELSLTTHKAMLDKLNPLIDKAGEILIKLFHRPIDITYNVQTSLAAIRNAKIPESVNIIYNKGDPSTWRGRVPFIIGQYILTTVEFMEEHQFGTDNMLRDTWLERAGENGILFEIVSKVQNEGTYDVVFEMGYCKLQVTPQAFGKNIEHITSNMLDRM